MVCGFNSRTPCGVRPTNCASMAAIEGFQFTHPVRGATVTSEPATDEPAVSIHAPRAGCDGLTECVEEFVAVSIHAPRAGCDSHQLTDRLHLRVSIHAPRAGCDRKCTRARPQSGRFNSRTPCGVRLRGCSVLVVSMCFNSRTPCGVRLGGMGAGKTPRKFQFTHPVRGATKL